jgi:endoglucanase Acf2
MTLTRRFALALMTGALACVLGSVGLAGSAFAQPVKAGEGTYFLSPKGRDKAAPKAPFRTDALLATAAQTNQWYSTLIFNPTPEAIFAHPLTVRTTAAGFEVALPVKTVVPTSRLDTEIHYPHGDAIVLSPVAFQPEPAKLAKVSDWAIDIVMAKGADQLLATVAHGSPYASFRLSRGDVRVRLPEGGERLDTGADARLLGLKVKGRSYVVFGPTGVRWEPVSATEWIGRLPEGKGYFAATALPDSQPATLALLTKHAYAFVTGTKADWRYDTAASSVETTFSTTTQVMEGADHGPLVGLYPHHWYNNPSVAGKLGPAYASVRGPIKLLAAAQFKTVNRYQGFVPMWPGLKKDGPRVDEFEDLLKTDFRKRRELIPGRENNDNWRTSAYWQGKGLTRLTSLASVAEQQGELEMRDRLLTMVKDRMEFWFKGESSRNYFHYDKALGTVVSYPDEFFAVEQMNDHHFHYGYFIRAAAEVALRDPAWAGKERWGGMVELLIADIATTQRGGADFPFLRNFDVYEGHSWASGVGLGEWGNNQESSSEALNAWAGLILWGEVNGNKAMRDLGVYLYTTEVESINHYWFDIHGQVLPPEYKNVDVSMIFGGKFAHNTWWTDEPRQITGINLLPMAGFSTYLGRSPEYVKRNMAALKDEMAIYAKRGQLPPNPPPKDIWQDIFAMYTALADPAAGLAEWDRHGSFELGQTRSHTLHWMLSLQAHGTPDFSVNADTTLYQVFKRADGGRTYLAYNATTAPITVRFSDGKTLAVPPMSLAQTR